MDHKVVITGIGVILPGTDTLDALRAAQAPGRTHVRQLSSGLTGSEIDESIMEGRLPGRLSKKLDAFTRYALVATESALSDARLDLGTVDRDRCGVFVGNSFGGWVFTEEQLRNLHCDGPRAVSPFQATSWFPAAPQGQITILHGIKGRSKTYMADRASSLLSVGSAASLNRRGDLDVAIAGGTESTNTDFVRLALASIAANASPESANAFAVTEGAVFLVLESRQHAVRRGARIYAEVGGFATRNSPCEADRYSTDPGAVTRAMRQVCGDTRPDLIMLDACGLSESDEAETQAIRDVFGAIAVSAPKARYGHAFGAEGALDIAYACLAVEAEQPWTNPGRTAHGDAARGDGTHAPNAIERILINARATGGAASSLLIIKGDSHHA
jgi:3-oxoacyl-(acyl-carrier-protein) synthase